MTSVMALADAERNGTPSARRWSAPRGDVSFLDRRAPGRVAEAAVPAVRVLLAAGERLVRAAVRELLEVEDDITVAEEAASGWEAVALASEIRPDVVLMSARLPGLDGLEATRRITTRPELSRVRVLILGDDERDEDLFAALRAGASAVMSTAANPAELIRAVRALAGGGVQLSPRATLRLIERFAFPPIPEPSNPKRFEELTGREREVVALVALGRTNREIAEQLVVSGATVKTHVSRSMVKLDVHHRAKLVALAYETGFAAPHPSAAPREQAPSDLAHGPVARGTGRLTLRA
jgi:DNA-binding NarL/FixJ family response regulator